MKDSTPLSLQLGTAVAKAACQLWAGPGVAAASLSLSVGQIFARRSNEYYDQKSGERTFDRIGEDISIRLSRFIEVEFSDLASNEKSAAISALTRLIQQVPLDPSAVIDANLSPVPMEHTLRSASRPILESAALSDSGRALFDRLLTDCTNYLVEIVVTLPKFDTLVAGEILQRESAILEKIQEVLEKLPASAGGGQRGEIAASASFATEYKRQLLRKLDWLDLFGVDLDPASKRYALSVAYVSLDVSTSEPDFDEIDTETLESPTALEDSDVEPASLRAEAALSRHPRVLLRGEAGSGKTTLLRWLAVRAARSDFSGELASWNGRMPFVVELRSYVGKELPTPEEFVQTVAKPMVASKPGSWVTDQLTEGNSIVLVDGLDELPAEERSAARLWLRDLVSAFPAVSFVVSSRPAAVSEAWLADDSFVDIELQPMSSDDIEAFIERWHSAAREGSKSAEVRSELHQYEVFLKALVRRTPSLRNLATSPLLCAMLCGLNRDRRKQLPRDRLGLYRVALESLLDRRDLERGVTADAVEKFGLDEKLLLLQDLAHWLLINGKTSASKTNALERFSAKIENMPRLNARPEEILRHMLVRSGVLREPIEGTIDFIHRTFLEYLAAAEAIAQGNTGLLVENAHRDQWREVIILASGHASTPQREALIADLLDRASRDATHRHLLQLLAIACLETSPELSVTTQSRLGKVLQGLLPPASLSEAKALARAGDLAAPLLRRDARWNVHEAVSSVRCLAMIGTDAALEAISSYMGDRRVMVCRELLRAWPSFDATEYAVRVLAQNRLDRGGVVVSDPQMVASLPQLEKLRWASISIPGKQIDLSVLAGVPIYQLDARDNNLIENLDWLEVPDMLRHLDLERCSKITDVSQVSRATGLVFLDISATKSLLAFPDLSSMEAMQSLYVSSQPLLVNLAFAASMPNLRRLDAFHSENLASLDGLENCPQLVVLNLTGARLIDSISPIATVENLTHLTIGGTGVTDLRPLSNLRKLKTLICSNTTINSLHGLEDLILISTLDLDGCRGVDDISPLQSGTGPLTLDLRGTQVKDLTPLSSRKYLTVYTSVSESDLKMPEPRPPHWFVHRLSLA